MEWASQSPGRTAGAVAGMGLISLLSAGLSGCAALPSSGPDTKTVLHASQGPQPAFPIIDLITVSREQLAAIAPPPPTLVELPSAQTPADRLEVGDVLQVTVFEVGAALFMPPQASVTAGVAPAAAAEALPPMPIGPDGQIVLPYIGAVQAAGRSPGELAQVIEAGLRGKSQSPQVVVSVRDDVGNSVVLIGDVKSPGRKSLNYRRERLLDMVAIAGGPANSKLDTIVRVTRGGRSVEMTLGDVQSGAPDDIPLQPQDRIELIYRPRTFTAFGATGKVSEIALQNRQVSLAEALARMGGPLDQQADSTGIFLFRRTLGAAPVVYRLNMKDPRAYFVAQTFEVRDKDVILIANARADAWYKLLSIFNTLVTPVVTAKYLGQ